MKKLYPPSDHGVELDRNKLYAFKGVRFENEDEIIFDYELGWSFWKCTGSSRVEYKVYYHVENTKNEKTFTLDQDDLNMCNRQGLYELEHPDEMKVLEIQ
jgi:hypothetical protein